MLYRGNVDSDVNGNLLKMCLKALSEFQYFNKKKNFKRKKKISSSLKNYRYTLKKVWKQ